MAAGTTRTITERYAAPFTGTRVDRAAGTIDGVLICGTKSLNGRDYPLDVFRRDHAKYEGRPVNADHADRATVDRRIGWFSGVHLAEDGRPRGRLNLLKSHPLYERVVEAAERNPALFGFSHVVDAKTRYEGGREVIEEITAVESIDLVADPATTKGLYESQGGRRMKLREYLDKLAPRLGLKRVAKATTLAEMDGMDAVDVPADAPAADTADPDAAIDTAFASAMHAQVDAFIAGKLDLPGMLGKLKELAKAHGNVTDSGEGGGGEEEAPAEEGKKKKPGQADPIREAVAVCGKVGFKGFTAEDLETIAAVPAARREALAKRLMGGGTIAEGERPAAAGRHQVAAHRDEQAAAKTLREGRDGAAGGKPDDRIIPAWGD